MEGSSRRKDRCCSHHRFDASAFACQIAAEVRNFDPLNYIEKKELKKMARFIHLAIAAADEAMKMSGLKVTPENDERVGVHMGSGIGGFDIIEREHRTLLEGGPAEDFSFLYSCHAHQPCRRQVSMRFGAKGPNEATATACTTAHIRLAIRSASSSTTTLTS